MRKRPKQLEDEDGRLKKLVTDLSLEKQVLKNIAGKIVSPALRQHAASARCATSFLTPASIEL